MLAALRGGGGQSIAKIGGVGPVPNGLPPGANISPCCLTFGVATIAAWPLRVHTEVVPLSEQLAEEVAPAVGANRMAAAAAPPRKIGARIFLAMVVDSLS